MTADNRSCYRLTDLCRKLKLVDVNVLDQRKRSDCDRPFGDAADFEVCRKLHRKFGTTYYYATRRFEPQIRRRTHALYGFVRVPDEWVDNPGSLTLEQRVQLLRGWRTQLLQGMDGIRPEHPVMRGFCDVVRETGMSLDEPLCFLDAMEQDLSVGRYERYGDLRNYMRGSAAAVGIMMLHVMGVPRNPEIDRAASALGEAMQLTNFIRDIGEDLSRGRIYMPLEDLESLGVSEGMFAQGKLTPEIVALLKFEVARARALYAEADRGIPMLPPRPQIAVRLARVLYAKILDKVEERDYDVFNGRARTTKLEKLVAGAKVLLS